MSEVLHREGMIYLTSAALGITTDKAREKFCTFRWGRS